MPAMPLPKLVEVALAALLVLQRLMHHFQLVGIAHKQRFRRAGGIVLAPQSQKIRAAGREPRRQYGAGP